MHPQTLPFSQSPSTPPSFWAERALFGRISPNWFFSSLFLSDFPQHFTFKCEPAYLLLVNPVPIFLLLFPLLFFPLYSSFQRSKPPEWEGAKPFINLHTHTNSLFPTYTKNSFKKHISQFSFQSFAHYTLVTTRKKHTADTKDFFLLENWELPQKLELFSLRELTHVESYYYYCVTVYKPKRKAMVLERGEILERMTEKNQRKSCNL